MVCIITFARSWQALVATRALGKAGIKVITADTEKYATAFFSRYSKENFLYPDPGKDEKGFIRTLAAKADYYRQKYDEDVVILPVHKETYIISKYKKQLEKHARLCIDDYSKIMSLHCKASVVSALKKYSIPHPKTYIIKDIIDLYKLVPQMEFPVFMKFRESSASIGIERIAERDDLIHRYSDVVKKNGFTIEEYPIIQESVDGRDYCVTALFNHGKLRAMMTYMNIRTYPYKSGTGVYRKTVHVKEMESQARKLLEKMRWHGLIEMDFRMGRDKKPYFIEANPRFWGGLNQSVSAGINYPLLAYSIAMDGDCRTITKTDNSLRTENLGTALLALFDELNKDEKKQKELGKLYAHWKLAFREKDQFIPHMQSFIRQLGKINEQKHNIRIIGEFMKRRKLVKDDILDGNDPFAVMGIFYPVHLFLKYGKVDDGMLTGEKK